MTTDPIDLLLSRLEPFKLKRSGQGRWRACCPAHGGSNPSALSVAVGTDGRVLLKCFGGCDTDSVVRALGLDIADLFPRNTFETGGAGAIRRRNLLGASQALQLLDDESMLVAIAAANLSNGIELSQADRDRLMRAAGRIAYLRQEVTS